LSEKQSNAVAEQGNNIAIEIEEPPVPDGGGDVSVDSDNSEDSEDSEVQEETRVNKTRSERMGQPRASLNEEVDCVGVERRKSVVET
jgi:hypothetical protein